MLRPQFLPSLLLAVIVFLFFSRLFFPEPKLFYTPDYGRSDIWQQNYPFKEFLSRSLKEGHLPFWSSRLGNGFPVFAEGQTGTLYAPNLILFSLFPTWLAWNINYLVTFFLASLGAFLMFQRVGVTQRSSFLASIVFGFSGYFVTKIVHINYIQAAVLLPWIFWLGDLWWEKPTWKFTLGFGLLVAQQVFTGGFQWVFITLLTLSLYLVVQFRERDLDALVKKLGAYAAVVAFGLALAAPQILPTIEFSQSSARTNGLSTAEIFQYPYPIKHLLSFVLPDYFGTPKDGSYPSPFGEESIGIYWENTAYVGVLPLLLTAVAVVKKRKYRKEKAIAVVGIGALLLALGKHSPLSFLYTYAGFNYFRVPSRFLIVVVLSLTALAGFGLDWVLRSIKTSVRRKRVVYGLVLTLAIVDVMRFGYSYHPLVTVRQALEPPESRRFIPEDARILTHPTQDGVWNDVFFSGGWQDIEAYLFFKNSLQANLNLVFDRSSILVSTAFKPVRHELMRAMIPFLVHAAATTHVVSPMALEGGDELELVGTVQAPRTDLPSYSVYQITKSLDRFRFASHYQVGLASLEETASASGFPFADTVLLEEDPGLTLSGPKDATVAVVSESEQELVLQTQTDSETFLVVADSFYPGWEATIDRESAQILPANVNQRALLVPPGEHIIAMRYVPRSFSAGLVVSATAILTFTVLAFLVPRLAILKPIARALGRFVASP